MNPESDARAQAVIDAALRRLGTADPARDFQGRILTRLAAERMKRDVAPLGSPLFFRLRHIWRATGPALYCLSACLIAGIVVAGSVTHSHRLHAAPFGGPPVLTLPSQGVGAASAVHPAAPASTPAPIGHPGRASHTNRKGRARIAPHAHKAPGVALPAPAPDSQN
ncbi:MAG TPA: hypothetical protein VHX37_00470 [Acidobacteriaceae bacterium]|jgi:hypothetical protein|nr:hypothetical protein [Acidobacteriaceae bacterium]